MTETIETRDQVQASLPEGCDLSAGWWRLFDFREMCLMLSEDEQAKVWCDERIDGILLRVDTEEGGCGE